MMDYIEISGYKSIKKIRLDLKPINILIGANGSGKSNFLSFFDFLGNLYNQNLQQYISLKGGEDKILHRGKKITSTLSFEMEFEKQRNGYSVDLKSGEDGFVFLYESLLYKGDHRNINVSGKEAIIKNSTIARADYVRTYLDGLRKYHFHDTGPSSAFSKYSHVENDIHYFYGDGMNIAAFIYNIEQKNKLIYNRIVETIQSIAPYFLNFFFAPNAEKNR